MDEKSLHNQVNASGFPFQLRVESLVKETIDTHKWRVLSTEHPWKDIHTGKEGYIDIVLESMRQNYRRYLVIECKRMKNDGRWVFLKSSPHETDYESFVLWANKDEKDAKLLFWEKMSWLPDSFISAFCTVPGQADKQTPMLERISSELLHSVECLAYADTEFPFQVDHFGTKGLRGRAMFLPVLVTNTEIKVHLIYPNEVDLLEGEIPVGKGKFETVPYVRFQKSFFTRYSTSKVPMNFFEASQESQRTVFVVHAPSLPNFLKLLNY